jgi:hypothetical protein
MPFIWGVVNFATPLLSPICKNSRNLEYLTPRLQLHAQSNESKGSNQGWYNDLNATDRGLLDLV